MSEIFAYQKINVCPLKLRKRQNFHFRVLCFNSNSTPKRNYARRDQKLVYTNCFTHTTDIQNKYIKQGSLK